MIRFLTHMTAFLAVQAGVLYYFASGWRTDNHFLRSTLLKHELLEKTPSPRILLIGGSSVVFGFRSDLMEEAFGLPVINLGLHAGFYRDYIFNEAEDAIGPGDIVLILPEYTNFCHYAPSIDLLKVAYFRPANLQFYSWRDWAWCGDHGLELLTNLVNAGWNDRFKQHPPMAMPYRWTAFNQHGDCATDLSPRYRPGPWHSLPAYYVEAEKAVDRLLVLSAACRAKGARMFFGYPPHCKEVTTAGLPALQELDRYIRRRLDCPVLWHPEETFYPSARHLDSMYHLADEAARDHTRFVISRLKPHLSPSEDYPRRPLDNLAGAPTRLD